MRDKRKARPGAATPGRAEDRQTHSDTAANPAHKSNTTTSGGQRRIADFLSRGRENAIPRRDLERLTKLAPREVSLAVERERRAGVPILADGRGYFLPASEKERAECVRSLRHRAGEILTTARAVERGKIEYEEGL